MSTLDIIMPVFAQAEAVEVVANVVAVTAERFSSVDTIWVLFGTALVFFMQAGFTMVEAGFTRAKNTGNIIMKNMMDFSLGAIFYWFIGFGLMFGTTSAYTGWIDIGVQRDYSFLDLTFPVPAFLIFQTVFCATAATIVAGAMAERTKFSTYCLYSVVISGLIYPVSGHWIWGGGWLAERGFHDFAGSTAVHLVGGIAAFIGAAILGPRIGKYSVDGKPKAILGSNLAMGALGVFILWFSWFGFNGASTVSATGDDSLMAMGTIFVTTNLAAAVASATTMIVTWIRYGKPDVSMTLNGALAGLVGVTAGCDAVSPVGAAVIGVICGTVLVFAVEFIDKVLRVDDPVGAVAVHGVCGALGTILVGLLSLEEGLIYGHGAKLLTVQCIGVTAVIAWVSLAMITMFGLLQATVGIRCCATDEINGLDMAEHGLASSYADFMPATAQFGITPHVVPPSEAVPVEFRQPLPAVPKPHDPNNPKMTKVVIIFRQEKFEEFKAAMSRITITGMTVSQVMGCGMQKGGKEFYRGIPIDIQLQPRVRVEIVICKVPLEVVVDTAMRILYTGNIGDGKIFVYDVENVIKIRTGEEGYDALQDE